MKILEYKTNNGYTIHISYINEYMIKIDIKDIVGLSVISFPMSISIVKRIFDEIENKLENAEGFWYTNPSMYSFDIALHMAYVDSEEIYFSLGEIHRSSYTITKFSIKTTEEKLKIFFAEFEEAVEYSLNNLETKESYSGAICS